MLRQLVEGAAILAVPLRHRLAVDTQTCHAAVRIDVEPQAIVNAGVVDREEMMGAGAERRCVGTISFHGVVAASGASDRAASSDAAGGIIAGEVAGIDVDAADAALDTELDDAEVVAAAAPSPRFPAVHPFAVGRRICRR